MRRRNVNGAPKLKDVGSPIRHIFLNDEPDGKGEKKRKPINPSMV